MNIAPVEETQYLQSAESVIEHSHPCVSSDPAEWVINNATIDILVSLEKIDQNVTEKELSATKTFYPKLEKHRSLKKRHFERKMMNGEIQERKYLIYSPSKKALFCIACRLFGGSSKLATTGYTDWKNVESALKSHENSPEHRKCQMDFFHRSKVLCRVDSKLQDQILTEISYWRNVLRRVVAVVKKLCSRGLPFRGSDERFGSKNNGNFMMCLELISEFDPFLATHIEKFGNPGRGKTSYLSSTVYGEFISLMASKIRTTILNEVKLRKYYSIVVDSTPDISHIDQLSLIIRYVRENGKPVERFVRFFPNVGHKAQSMSTVILDALTEYGLDLKYCRGQSYDNASNMSGCYGGLQALIREGNALAIYVPCSAHSLNLVGTNSVESINEVYQYFEYLQDLFTLFAGSTHRWQILRSILKPGQKVPKRVEGTRWYSRHDANANFCDGWTEIMKALENIENDKSQKNEVRCKAKGLRKRLITFESVFMMLFWNTLLERFYKTNLTLQEVDIDLGIVTDLYQSLVDFSITLRTDEMFEEFIGKARNLTREEYEYDSKRRVTMSGKENLKREVYFAALDRIRMELEKRMAAYKELFKRFNFLITIHKDQASSDQVILENARNFQQLYKDDIEESFPEECLHFRDFIKVASNKDKFKGPNFSAFLHDNDLDNVFPNVSIAFRIFLTLAISNCTAERSFSYLKRLKSVDRATLIEENLNDLAILVIEADLLHEIDFEELISDFAQMKSRRKMM